MKNRVGISYAETQAFSKLVIDYLADAPALQPFYAHRPDVQGIEQAIAAKANHTVNRTLLVDELKNLYATETLTSKQVAHLEALLQPNCFTITTAHQPNLFTGPLYFIYKIIHAIKLADELNKQFPQQQFVPVYYMGSEDADLDELGHFFIDGEKREWQTQQTGAVGRMKTENVEPLIRQLEGQFVQLPFGQYMVNLLRTAYSKPNIQEATFSLVNQLFAEFGLLIVVPDNAALKRQFVSVIQRELEGDFSQPAVDATTALLEQQYKVQVKGRPINMFYLDASGARERIEKVGHQYVVNALNLSWTKEEIFALTESNPECFSPNVILRGLLQETILPNVVFIGGGGELAYWMELKAVFEKANVPFPVLMLRNSLLLIDEKQQALQRKLAWSYADLFQPLQTLLDAMAAANNDATIDVAKEEAQLQSQYSQWQEAVAKIDVTLQPYVASLHTAALKGLRALHKKMKRAARQQLGDRGRQAEKLKAQLFPNGGLQERVENVMPFLAQYGPGLLQEIYDASPAIEPSFTIVDL